MILIKGTVSWEIDDTIFFNLVAPTYTLFSLAAIASRFLPFLKTFSQHGKTLSIESTQLRCLWVSKRNFRHFYIAGLFSLIIHFSRFDHSIYPSAPEITLGAHLIRRTLECLYVHTITPSSKMHIAGWILGIGHYIILPLVFVGRHTKPGISVFSATMVLSNLLFQFEQYEHHRILAGLRKKGQSSHKLPPSKRWFRYVLCPHYLAEMLIYLTWALMLHGHDPASKSDSLIEFGLRNRHWFLFLWVATNLTVSSLNSAEWYKSRYRQLSRSALIPYLL